MTITTKTDKTVSLLKNKNAMINKPTAAIAYTYNLPGSSKSYTPPFYVQEYTRAPSVY